MTRNSKKFQNQSQNQKEEVEIPTPVEAPPLTAQQRIEKLSFVVPTEIVDLPTKGKFYPASSPLSGVEKVEIRHMTAKEEDLLSSITSRPDIDVYARLIDSLLVDENLDSSMFCEEDKTAILLKSRITGYGRNYTVRDFCYSCQKIGVFSFDLSNVEIIEPTHEVEYDPETDEYQVTLPVSEIPISLKQFTPKDEEELMLESKKKQELGIEFNYTISYINRIITSIDGFNDKALIKKLSEVMPAADAKFLNTFYDKCRPKISTLQDVECPSCGASSRKEVPVSWAFFRINQ